MKIISKFSMTVLAGLMLAACSSGGGSGDHSSSKADKPSVKPTPVKPTEPNAVKPAEKPNTSNQPAVNNVGTGATYITSYQDDNKKVIHKVLNNADNLNFIVVDGKQVRVSFPDVGLHSGAWSEIQNSSSCCGKFSSVRFGVIGSNGSEENDYLFYNGKPTQNVPTSGNASYTGYFAITGDIKQFDDEDYLFGNAKFNVDFANKQLKGSLEEKSLKPISIDAKIDGNSFVGSASSSEFGSKANVEGKFFGDKAKELGGVFEDSKHTWGGAFGAAQ